MKLVIFGTGGFAREVHQLFEDLQTAGEAIEFLGFLDGNTSAKGNLVHGFPVHGDEGWLFNRPEVEVAVGIGGTSTRQKIVSSIKTMGARKFPLLIHPSAKIGNRIEIGEGTIICAGSIATTDIKIGKFVVLNLDCTVGHDAVLGDFVTAAPSVNISGNVVIGEGCDLGTGSGFIQGIRIGQWSVVGAGAVVIKDLPPNVTAVGAPAKPIKERPQGWQL